MIKVSIIIPVYNTEKFLNRCVDSVINQKFNNFEIILVNDGSKDNSLKICRDYEKKYPKIIKVIDQKNSGPAIARNRGIESAKGKYIMFIDSDDFIDDGYIKDYYDNIEKTKDIMVIGGYKRVEGTDVVSTLKLKQGDYSKYLITGPVCRIIRREYLEKNNILFLDTNSSEDVYFNLLIYNKTNKISIIENTGYNYYYNCNSLSNTVHKGFNQDVKIIELLDLVNIKDGINCEMNQYFIIKYCIWYLLYSGKSARSDEFIKEYNKLFTWIKLNIPNYKKNKYISCFKPSEEPLMHRLVIYIFIVLSNFKLVSLFSKIYCKGI